LEFFHKKRCLDKNNQIIFVNYKFTFQRFGEKIRDAGAKTKTLFDVLVGFWHSKSKYVILEHLSSPTFLFGLYLNKTFKICSIDLNH
jgi:hypothetical protein